MSARAPIAALTLRNEGDQPMLLQLETVQWAMQGGEDRYTPTSDILATPPIFTIPSGQEQVVRVGMRRPVAGAEERTYRLFLQEPPLQTQASVTRVQGLNVTLRIGVPVFVAPVVTARTDLDWRALLTGDGAITIEATNSGNVHARFTRITLANEDGETQSVVHEGLAYLLPGSTRQWSVRLDEALVQRSIHLRADTEDGTVEFDLELERS